MTRKSNLVEKLKMFGFPLLESERPDEANEVLAQLVKSKDARLWEGFPVVLANSAQRGLFDYASVMKKLKDSSHKKTFRQLLLVSLALYKAVGVKFSWVEGLLETGNFSNEEFDKVYQQFRQKGNAVVYGGVSVERLKNAFSNYFKQEEGKLAELASLQEEFGLEYALSQVFSPKQKELFLKKLKGEKLTKTEREYYSRAVRKKVEALANAELHQLAQKLK